MNRGTPSPSYSAGASGPERWIQEAVDRFEWPLIQYVHRLLGDRERARDVVQDSFLRLCDRGPRLHEDARTNHRFPVRHEPGEECGAILREFFARKRRG